MHSLHDLPSNIPGARQGEMGQKTYKWDIRLKACLPCYKQQRAKLQNACTLQTHVVLLHTVPVELRDYCKSWKVQGHCLDSAAEARAAAGWPESKDSLAISSEAFSMGTRALLASGRTQAAHQLAQEVSLLRPT